MPACQSAMLTFRRRLPAPHQPRPLRPAFPLTSRPVANMLSMVRVAAALENSWRLNPGSPTRLPAVIGSHRPMGPASTALLGPWIGSASPPAPIG